MKLKAIDLFNVLKQYYIKELKTMNVVIEINRNYHNQLGQSAYSNLIEEYPSQIRIINKGENQK